MRTTDHSVLLLNCTLKHSPEASSCQLLAEQLLGGFAASRVLEVHGDRLLQNNFKPGFPARLYRKDLRIVMDTLDEAQVAAPVTAIVQQLLTALVADGKDAFLISGKGDVISSDEGLLSVGSGSMYALAAARALIAHTQLSAVEIAREAMRIAADICIYTNSDVVIEEI